MLLDFVKAHAPYLLAGLAALSAFWGQARSFLSYISSWCIVRAKLDYQLSHVVSKYLRKEYTRAPSGIYLFHSLYLPTTISSVWRMIPFRMPSMTTLYHGKRGWFLSSWNSNSGLILTGIRKTCDMQGVVSDALDFYSKIIDSETSQVPFILYKIMGSMGDMWAQMAKNGRGGDPGESSVSNNPIQTNSGNLLPDLKIDTPFKYEKSDFFSSESTNPFKGLFYNEEVSELIQDALQWKKNEKWYLSRGIPWRRGWLLYGPGGTGKSSIAKATAQKLGIPLYQFFLSTLNDREFVKEWEGMQVPAVALFEDFDNVFNLRESTTQHKALTFDCILNQISGVGSINGLLLIVTTNRLDRIDPALGQIDENGVASRPGRIDRIIRFGETNRTTREKIVNYILPDFQSQHEELIERGEGMTPAQFQHICIDFAFSSRNIATEKPKLSLVEEDTNIRAHFGVR